MKNDLIFIFRDRLYKRPSLKSRKVFVAEMKNVLIEHFGHYKFINYSLCCDYFVCLLADRIFACKWYTFDTVVRRDIAFVNIFPEYYRFFDLIDSIDNQLFKDVPVLKYEQEANNGSELLNGSVITTIDNQTIRFQFHEHHHGTIVYTKAQVDLSIGWRDECYYTVKEVVKEFLTKKPYLPIISQVMTQQTKTLIGATQ